MSKPEDTFLGRWSRKKLEPQTEIPDDAPSEPTTESPGEDLSDEEILERLELPDPESLKEGDDFAAFMNAAVPDHLRKRALRKLWLSNPALANLDGLVDYGEDYTDAAMVPEVLNTAYKVGRGFLKDVLEGEPDPEPADEADSEAIEVVDDVADQPSLEESDVALDQVPEVVLDVEPTHVPRARMVFTTQG